MCGRKHCQSRLFFTDAAFQGEGAQKPMAKSINYVAETPRGINQNKLGYRQDVGWYACWVAAAEMVKSLKSRSMPPRPQFEPATDTDSRIALFLKQEAYLKSMGFNALRDPAAQMSAALLVDLLRKWGPLYAYGLFFLDDTNPIFRPVQPTASNRMNGDQHAICVYGMSESFGGVYYIDPWDGFRKTMSLSSFAMRLHPVNSFSLAGCRDNLRR